MSSLRVSGLGKAFRQYPDRWARLREWIDPWHRPRHTQKWVLRGLDFAIGGGEAVGIIGINGAGKSTLLKTIAGITGPTEGSVSIQGRVAALLELGLGFHPDYTGRQNVLMAGQLQGFSAQHLQALIPDIEAFAEIGEYFDQPLRVYSSGMQVRLAFALATAVRPDILIVDEALSVGDTYFQHKSFERIRSFNREGTTLLLVSHDRHALQSVCERVILIDAGRLAMDGPAEAVLDYYNALLAHRENSKLDQVTRADGRVQTQSGTGEATVAHIELLDADGRPVDTVDVTAQLCLRIVVDVRSPLERMVLGYMIKDRFGQEIFGTNTHYTGDAAQGLQAGDRVEYRVHFKADLGPGSYSITTALTEAETHLQANYEWRDMALLFSVVNLSQPTFVGCNWMAPRIETIR